MATTEIASRNSLDRATRRNLKGELLDKNCDQKRGDDRSTQMDRLAQWTVGGVAGAVVRWCLCRRFAGKRRALDDCRRGARRRTAMDMGLDDV